MKIGPGAGGGGGGMTQAIQGGREVALARRHGKRQARLGNWQIGLGLSKAASDLLGQIALILQRGKELGLKEKEILQNAEKIAISDREQKSEQAHREWLEGYLPKEAEAGRAHQKTMLGEETVSRGTLARLDAELNEQQMKLAQSLKNNSPQEAREAYESIARINLMRERLGLEKSENEAGRAQEEKMFGLKAGFQRDLQQMADEQARQMLGLETESRRGLMGYGAELEEPYKRGALDVQRGHLALGERGLEADIAEKERAREHAREMEYQRNQAAIEQFGREKEAATELEKLRHTGAKELKEMELRELQARNDPVAGAIRDYRADLAGKVAPAMGKSPAETESLIGGIVRGEPQAQNEVDQARVRAALQEAKLIPQEQKTFLPTGYVGMDEAGRAQAATDLATKLLGAAIGPTDRKVAIRGILGEAGDLTNYMKDIENKVGANLGRTSWLTGSPYIPQDFAKEFSHIKPIPQKPRMGVPGATMPAYGMPSAEELAQYRALQHMRAEVPGPTNRFLQSSLMIPQLRAATEQIPEFLRQMPFMQQRR